jgi:hypothetical protein
MQKYLIENDIVMVEGKKAFNREIKKVNKARVTG